jgi:hypothetical protein
MKNAKRTLLIVLLFCMIPAPVCSAGDIRSKAKPQHPTAFELLDRYAETQDKLQSFIVKGSSSADIHGSYSSPQHKPYSGRKRKFVSYEFRYNGNRFYWRRQMWGNLRFAHEFVSKSKPHYKSVLWDGAVYYEYAKAPYIRTGPGTLEIDSNRDPASVKKTIPYIPYICAPMFGFFGKEQIDSILRRAETISIRDKLQRVGQSNCYVIDAVTKSGKYSIWIDPNHGYNIAKAEIRRAENDLVNGERMAKGHTLLTSLKNVRFEKVSNVWIPTEADLQQANNLPNGDFSRVKTHYGRTEFILKPDNNALGTFLPRDIEDGAKVMRINGVRVRGHTWQNGQVLDDKGQMIFDSKSKKASR